MKRLRLVGLGIRLAVAGGRPAWIRIGLMSLGFTVGASLLLGAASILPALNAKDVREYTRYGDYAGHRQGGKDLLRQWGTPQAYGALQIRVTTVKAIGDAPAPPGLTRPPEPGEIFLSPGLAELWNGAMAETLEHRLHAHVAGTIAPAGVLGPDELYAWLGKPAGVRLGLHDGYAVSSFRYEPTEQAPLDLGALVIFVAIGSAILLPIWLFVATATRLSAASREARLAAVRLAGGTQAQVRVLAGVEAGVAAAIGALAGFPLFLSLRPFLAHGMILGFQLFPWDFAPPTALVVAILVALPVLAVAMSLLTMRRLIVSPLGIARRARRSWAGWRWLLVLVAGLAILSWAASHHAARETAGDVTMGVLIGSGLTLTAFGLIGTATWSAWLLARWLAGRSRSVARLLGMRRLEADPSSVGRIVGGVALMIALVGVVQAGLVAIEHADQVSLLAMWTKTQDPDAVVVTMQGTKHWKKLNGLADVPGVTSAEITKELPTGGVRSRPTTAILQTDSRPETLEALRDDIGWYADVFTVGQLRAQDRGYSTEYDELARGVMLITLFLLLVNGATLLVAMVDWMMERRRAMAVLSATGVQAAVLRRSILAQVALPLTTSVAFGFAGAVAVIALLFTTTETPIVYPLWKLAELSIAAAAVVVAVTTLSMPWVRAVRRPELLRNE